ncbi:hypothetical protein ACFSMW_01215 [Virgibacillus halophilus]|uniref:Uncharacterized protein n=1 Tax=Tigheibacillus halophilus TaxID=361280 RepID=A0ABU5CA71_9BACI|nr:hypothetical protein [Virgibacillus halophilus]
MKNPKNTHWKDVIICYVVIFSSLVLFFAYIGMCSWLSGTDGLSLLF